MDPFLCGAGPTLHAQDAVALLRAVGRPDGRTRPVDRRAAPRDAAASDAAGRLL